jgi:hypothetical protein
VLPVLSAIVEDVQRKVGHLFDGKFSVMTECFPSKKLYKKSAMCAILIFINGLLKFSGA